MPMIKPVPSPWKWYSLLKFLLSMTNYWFVIFLRHNLPKLLNNSLFSLLFIRSKAGINHVKWFVFAPAILHLFRFVYGPIDKQRTLPFSANRIHEKISFVGFETEKRVIILTRQLTFVAQCQSKNNVVILIQSNISGDLIDPFTLSLYIQIQPNPRPLPLRFAHFDHQCRLRFTLFLLLPRLQILFVLRQF